MAELAYYVYCIAESAAAAQLPVESLPAAIEDDSKLEWISVNTLAALASRVPRATYSEENLAEQLTDATWTAIRAMRHETVVEFVAKRATVIPLRFGTIYLERSGVEHARSIAVDAYSVNTDRRPRPRVRLGRTAAAAPGGHLAACVLAPSVEIPTGIPRSVAAGASAICLARPALAGSTQANPGSRSSAPRWSSRGRRNRRRAP